MSKCYVKIQVFKEMCNSNSPIPSHPKPLFQSMAWCTTIHIYMS